jgi:hypothetical protein
MSHFSIRYSKHRPTSFPLFAKQQNETMYINIITILEIRAVKIKIAASGCLLNYLALYLERQIVTGVGGGRGVGYNNLLHLSHPTPPHTRYDLSLQCILRDIITNN